ncbi:hypothetical protein CJ030_MR6G013313 [Morella rubra]|uniref:Uncharacterized protein n=1 Tax=Morella rubra TaxID=262757 RepID=A0A6A1VFR7_9ROSI|nr:hypothetical protein CJ030_MR6G013313 [Morella rubra]
MTRKQNGLENTSLILLVVGLISCAVVFTFFSAVLRPSSPSVIHEVLELVEEGGDGPEGERGGCCRGIENLELSTPYLINDKKCISSTPFVAVVREIFDQMLGFYLFAS